MFGPIARLLAWLVACLALVRGAPAQAPKPAAAPPPPPPPIVVREEGRLVLPAGSLQPGAQPVFKCVAAAGTPLAVTAVAFSPDEKLLAAADAKGVVLWDLEGAKLLKRIGEGQLSGTAHALAFSKDGKLLAVGEGVPSLSGAVRLFDVQSGQQAAAFQEPKDVVDALAASGDGTLLAAGAADGKVYVWALADKRLLATIPEHRDWVLGVAFSPDGKLLASGGADRSVQLWEAGTWKSVNRFLQADPVQATAFTPDGKLLSWAIAGPQNRMVRWREPLDPPDDKKDLKKPRVIPQVRTIDTAGGTPLAMVWGALQAPNQQPQPRLYVACGDKTVKVYNNNGGMMASLIGHGDWVYCVAVSASGARFASGSADGTVKLWHGGENRPLATLARLSPDREEWLILTAPGYFTTSTPAAIGWDKMKLTLEPAKLAELLAKPELVRDWLAGKKVAMPALK
jgi:WD40 repeat protein